MIIHVVQPGENIYKIAKRYGITVEKLISDNGLQKPYNLVTGEALLILIPLVTHIVQEGDTLSGIANFYGITVTQLLRNNPFLSNREYIYPGESIVIYYSNEKAGKISTYGYAYPHIGSDVLRMTLPYLTYITVYSYTFTDDGSINDIDDQNIIEIAKNYHVAPIMMLNPENDRDDIIINTMNSLLANKKSQVKLFDNVLNILREKGYYGVNLNVPYIHPPYRDIYVDFMIKFSSLLKNEGYSLVFNTLSLSSFEIMTGKIYKEFDYASFVQYIDGLFLMSYEWGNYVGIPTCVISFDKIREIIIYMNKIYPSDTIYLGIPILGYIWELPFILGVSKGIAVTSNAAIELAKSLDTAINYDYETETAYFDYIRRDREYTVRFRDIRSINDYMNLVNELGLTGVSIWNIMQFFPQLWLAINALYDINNFFDNDDKS